MAGVDFFTAPGQHSRGTELPLWDPRCLLSTDVSEGQRHCRGPARKKSGSSKAGGAWGNFDLGVGLPGQWDVLGEECGLDLLGRVTDPQ